MLIYKLTQLQFYVAIATVELLKQYNSENWQLLVISIIFANAFSLNKMYNHYMVIRVPAFIHAGAMFGCVLINLTFYILNP